MIKWHTGKYTIIPDLLFKLPQGGRIVPSACEGKAKGNE